MSKKSNRGGLRLIHKGVTKMYRVVIWDTGEVLGEFANLATAKKIARNRGHSGDGTDTQFSPIARVDGPMRDGPPGYGVEYNPRFYRGKHDDFKAIPYVRLVVPGPRKCSHGLYRRCPKGCN